MRGVGEALGASALRLGLLALAAAALAQPAFAAPTAPLSQSGRWVVDARGRVVLLHGVNMVNKRPPYDPAATGFDDDDARFLRREGFNTVRLGVIYKAVEPAPGRYDDAYLDRIAATVKALSREGIFALLDFHQDLYNERFSGEGFPDWAVQDDGLPAVPDVGFPGNYLLMPALNRAFDHFWANDPGPGGVGLQERYAAAWRHVASRLGAEPYVMGYDLLNEPWPGSAWPTCANPIGCPSFDQRQLTPFTRRVYASIRRADSHGLVWYEPNVIYNNGPVTYHGDPGPLAGMSFHVYCLLEGNTPGPSPLDPLQEIACAELERLPFQRADEQSARTGDALLLTEFGATDDLGQIERIAALADRYMVGWQYWHYCECADPTTSGVGPTQAIVLDPHRPLSGANVKDAKLLTLSRPYPQAVAGTPRSVRFDPGNGRFELEYTTARPGGGAYAPRADTQVFVPGRRYARGYDVQVEGGEPVSPPGAERLRVRTCQGRSRVRVTVAPAAHAGESTAHADCRVLAEPALIRLSVRPRSVVAGRRQRFRFRARANHRPVRGATIRLAGRRARTGARGRATIVLRLRRPGRYTVVATRPGLRPGRATIRVRRHAHRRRRAG